LILNAWADWNTISNQHFKIYYKDNWDAEAEKVIRTLEHYRPQLEQMTGSSKGQIPFTIEDIGNIVNGYTDVLGTRIALYAYPPTSDELSIGEDWWQMVACHEYLHELQMTRVSGTPALAKLLFGNIAYPHLWQPGWMTEGITVYGESKLTKYSGRMNGATYPAIISLLAKKDKLPSPTKASYFSFDTPQATYYTYGGAFYTYLTKTYGEDKLAKLFDITSSSTWSYSSFLLPDLFLDKAFKTVFGKEVSELWSDWINYEKQRNFTFAGNSITSGGWFKSNLQEHNGKLYYIDATAVKTGPGSSFMSYKLQSLSTADLKAAKVNQTARQLQNANSRPQTIIEQNGDFPAGYEIRNGNLYYTRSEWKRGFANSEMDGFGSIVQLWQQNLSTNERTKIYSGQLRAFCPMPDGSILISEDNVTHTKTTLSRLKSGSKIPTAVYQTDGLIYSIHPYGSNLILGYKPPWHNNAIYLYESAAKRLTPVINTPYFTSPVSVNGDSLVFNAVFDDFYSAYVMNLKSHSCYKLTNVSDVRTPVVLPGNRTYFVSLNEKGYDIYQEPTRLTPFQIPNAAVSDTPLAKMNLSKISESPVTRHGKRSAYFSNIGHLLVPRVLHLPIIYGTQDSMAIGAMLMGKDAVGDFPAWQAQVIYDTFRKKVIYSATLENAFFHPIKNIIDYTNDNEQSFSSTQYLELYKSQNYGYNGGELDFSFGLNSIVAGFSFVIEDNYTRTIWTPFVELGLQGPETNLTFKQFFPFETKDFLPSDRERTGWQGLVQLHQRLPLSSEFKGIVFTASDPDADLDEVFGTIRGYDKDFKVNKGTVIQTTVYKPILKIRDGIWSPQIYLEDINLGLFYDTAVPAHKNDIDKQYSYGAELLAELGLAYNYRINVGVRYSYNAEKENRIELIMNSLF